MKNTSLLFGFFVSAFLLSVSAMPAFAYNVPSLTISPITGSSQAQVTVYGADPNVSVLLYYPSSSSIASTNIGTTNASGYLTTTVNASTFGIASGAQVYVTVDGQTSPQNIWPSYASTGGLSLSQTSLSLVSGQSASVSASVSAPLSLSSNTNPTVAGVVVSGNQVNVTANAFGTTNITVCAANIGCGTILVTVSSTASGAVSSISFSQNNVTLATGQSQQIAVSGSGSYYISSNSNSNVVTSNMNGSTLTLSGVTSGTAAVAVCSSLGLSTTCGTVNVIVTLSSTPTSTTTPTLSFSQSNVTLSVGQNQSISIYGGNSALTVYYVSQNSNGSAVSANANGTSVTLYGVAFGGANITVCQSGGPCGTFYAYVEPSGNGGSAPSTPTVANTTAPMLTSFSVSSNDAGGAFGSPGSALSFSFTTNQAVNTPTVTIAGSPATVSGNGNGPYAVSYTIPSGVAGAIPVSVTFLNPSGTGGQASFSINSSAATANAATVTAPNCPVGYACTAAPTTALAAQTSLTASTGLYQFANYLYIGMTPQGVSNADVLALQKRLSKDGYFKDSATGYFGPVTKAAVEAYQRAHGLSPLGVVGPATRNLLNQGI